NAIVLNLLKFSRPSELLIERVKPEELVTEALALFKYRAPGSSIRIETRFEDTGVSLSVDRNQVQQVLFNLFSNATDAMPGGGDLMIRTFKSPQHAALGGRPACVIEITDSGEGIASENLKKLFEPFFTTKRDKRGTGLGLSMSKTIVENHKGRLLIESEAGKGTRVSVVLPLDENTQS
ncbi:MAG: ATP-binding protein, partial [Candidatus Omnitrophica bacterium]|nr:ATP-binding protein [Candidatus Omnitrophota bacterium]